MIPGTGLDDNNYDNDNPYNPLKTINSQQQKNP